MATVTLEQVTKRFATGELAVGGVDLHVDDGEFLCLVGASGCGKSTTLNLIAGLERPTSGVVRIAGAEVTRLGPQERDVAMVFQSYALYPHLDVWGNLAFPLKVAGLGRLEVKRRVEETAALLGLEGLLTRRPRELSGGQRVAIGRALVRRPAVYLFDEPLSNLDASLRFQMRGELKKLHERLGGTFIYVTHDQAEAMTLSDRVVLMNAGRLEQVGTATELYAAPVSLFCARFFGTPALNVCRPEALGLPRRDGALAALRPEHIELGEAGQVGPVAGRVYLVEPMGADAWVTVELALGVTRVVARCAGSVAVKVGDQRCVRFDPRRVLWFDERTGRRC